MRRSAGFTAIAVASLAVGIGAATATFAVTEAVMLRPLPVRNPERLVAFTTAADSGWATWSYAAFARWQRLPRPEVSTRRRQPRTSDRFARRAAAGSLPRRYLSASCRTTTSMRSALASCSAGRSPRAMPPHPAPGPSRSSATASGAGGSAARPTCWRRPSNWAAFSLPSSGSPSQDSPGSPSAIPPTCGSR